MVRRNLSQSESPTGPVEPSTYLPASRLLELGNAYRQQLNQLRKRPTNLVKVSRLQHNLQEQAYKGYQQIYKFNGEKTSSSLSLSLVTFLLQKFPQAFRDNSKFIGCAALFFALGVLVGMLTVGLNPQAEHYFISDAALSGVKAGRLWVENLEAAPKESAFLMANNIRVAMNAYAGGMIFGVGTLVILFVNGLMGVGGPLQVCFEYNLGDDLLKFMLAHGVIELTTIFIAGGAGMKVGFAMLFSGSQNRWHAITIAFQSSIILIAGCIPMLVIAGIIEGLISLNPNIGLWERVGIAGLSATGMVFYFGVCGLEPVPSSKAE